MGRLLLSLGLVLGLAASASSANASADGVRFANKAELSPTGRSAIVKFSVRCDADAVSGIPTPFVLLEQETDVGFVVGISAPVLLQCDGSWHSYQASPVPFAEVPGFVFRPGKASVHLACACSGIPAAEDDIRIVDRE
jgi:hypothetical protein